jgi:hypothetical protein
VEQALLGRDQGALAVDQDRAALQHERRGEQAHPQVRGDPRGQLRVLVVGPAPTPAVEPEPHRGDPAGGVPDEDRPLSRVQESLIGSSITSTARPHRFLTSAAVPGRHTIRTGSWSATARATAA